MKGQLENYTWAIASLPPCSITFIWTQYHPRTPWHRNWSPAVLLKLLKGTYIIRVGHYQIELSIVYMQLDGTRLQIHFKLLVRWIFEEWQELIVDGPKLYESQPASNRPASRNPPFWKLNLAVGSVAVNSGCCQFQQERGATVWREQVWLKRNVDVGDGEVSMYPGMLKNNPLFYLWQERIVDPHHLYNHMKRCETYT